MWNETLQTQYEAFVAGRAYARLSDHFIVQLTGADRHAFLHSFCTQDLKGLPIGHCSEAFVLNPKGKALAFVNVLAFEDAIWLLGADRSHAAAVIEHLDRYLIREDVQLKDLTDRVDQFFSLTPAATEAVGAMANEINQCQHMSDHSIGTAHIELAGFGHWFACGGSQTEMLCQQLADAGMIECGAEVLHAVRLEQRTPWSGSEADETNLPQELQRDEQAISFNKGCYLGQETVARLDALGRVNQLLVPIQFDDLAGQIIQSGAELLADEKVAGRVTSIAWSPQANAAIGLAYVRRKHAQPDSKVATQDGISLITLAAG